MTHLTSAKHQSPSFYGQWRKSWTHSGIATASPHQLLLAKIAGIWKTRLLYCLAAMWPLQKLDIPAMEKSSFGRIIPLLLLLCFLSFQTLYNDFQVFKILISYSSRRKFCRLAREPV